MFLIPYQFPVKAFIAGNQLKSDKHGTATEKNGNGRASDVTRGEGHVQLGKSHRRYNHD